MEKPKTQGSEVHDRPFATVVRDPAGVTYHVHAVPTFGSSGPVLLGGSEGPAASGLLSFVNRILAKRGKTRSHDGFAVWVYRDHPGGTIVTESEHASMRQARQAAQELVRAIEKGTLADER